MLTILDALSGITSYPIPPHTIASVAEVRGLSLYSEFSAQIGASAEYRLAEADLYEWLITAPDINIEGLSYSLTDKQRELFRMRAGQLRFENGEKAQDLRVKFGYKGSRL